MLRMQHFKSLFEKRQTEHFNPVYLQDGTLYLCNMNKTAKAYMHRRMCLQYAYIRSIAANNIVDYIFTNTEY